MLIGMFKLKQGVKSQITDALFVMILCLCVEIIIVTALVVLNPVTDSQFLIRFTARVVELFGTLWFMRSLFKGNKFIEGMLYREQTAQKEK